MGEFFEITFFSDKNSDIFLIQKELMDTLHICCGKNTRKMSSFQLLENRELYFQVFDESNYIELQLSVMDLVLTRDNFDLQLSQILDVVSACFDTIPSLLFATGIYELTDYYLEKVDCIQAFPQYFFPYMPLLFFKKDGNQYGYNETGNFHSVSYVVQNRTGIQDIFRMT